MKPAANRPEKPVFAFEARLSAERAKEPLTGMELQNAAMILARPCPINSWLSSHLVRVFTAITLQLDMASVKLTSAMTSAAGKSLTIASQFMAGTDRPGKPAGMAPTTWPPCCAKPVA